MLFINKSWDAQAYQNENNTNHNNKQNYVNDATHFYFPRYSSTKSWTFDLFEKYSYVCDHNFKNMMAENEDLHQVISHMHVHKSFWSYDIKYKGHFRKIISSWILTLSRSQNYYDFPITKKCIRKSRNANPRILFLDIWVQIDKNCGLCFVYN